MNVNGCQSNISRQFSIMGPKVLLSSPWNLKRAGRKGHYLLAFVRLSELRKQHERKKPLVQLVSEGTVSECQFVSILFF
jgi:hypothetical protein